MSSVNPVLDRSGFGQPGNPSGAAVPPRGIALIPLREAIDGPLSVSRQRRTLALYAAMVAIGLVLAFGAAPAGQAFGLGLLLPGGGFSLHLAGGWGPAAGAALGIMLSLLLFGAGLFAWFGSGNILAPIVAWLGPAGVAAALAPAAPWSGAPWLTLGAVVATAALVLRARARGRRQAVADRERRNAHLARLAARPVPDLADAVRDGAGVSDEACGYLRHILDRALQPVPRFDGFDAIDQFQTASIRYQCCNYGYALAALQYEHLPAFRGYLSEAQQRLHAKMLDHRNWKYWALENAWGNLSLDPNPVPRDNIMYSGWFGAMLAEYISNTGDSRYHDQPMVLRHPDGREWRYTFPQLAEAVYRNFKRSDFTLFPCEPNWIYPLCNNFGSICVRIHDRLYGTHWWSEIEADYRRHFDNEFTTQDGRTLAIRSSRTGLTIAALTSVMADCVTAYFLHGVLPDVARRAWEIARLDFIKVADGKVDLVTRGWDAIDTGNYKRSMITTYAQVGAAAGEMGDREVLELLRQRVRDEYPGTLEDGVRVIPGVSNFAYASLLGLFAQGAGVRRAMHVRGVPARTLNGPMLTGASYPDVLVTRAVNDGGVLAGTVRPGRAAAAGGVHALELGQLHPGGRYRCEGLRETAVTADAQGRATVHVQLAGRQDFRVAPLL
ncbi:MAG TPA: hypothetical protein VFA75_14570 [Nevskia sp.]|nr:hypothetical protein [Nevskia sp.]